MPGSIATSTAVDLSQLPPPDVVETLEFEAILAEIQADFAARYPDFDTFFESDPAIKLMEAFAYRELVMRQRINDAARACLIAYAAGGDLDNLAAIFGVTREVITPADGDTPAVMESDEDLRRRVLLAPDSYSVAGPTSAYVFHALSADGDVLDASATSPNPGEVIVTVMSRTGDGTAGAPLLAAVEAVVAGDTVRPLTDQVTVQSVELVPFAITANLTLYAGPDAQLIETTAAQALAAFLAANRRIGRDIPRSALIAALHVAGVQKVELVDPVADIVVTPLQVAVPGEPDLTLSGTAE